MERHRSLIQTISKTVKQFYASKEPYRIFHGSTNSTRPTQAHARSKVVDISALRNVLSVDTNARTALVEPNVPMDALVSHTLKYGLVPPVVMEFPGITAGGGFAGTAGESSSFRHGFFDDTVRSVEIVLPDGEVVTARPDKDDRYADLFRGAAGAVGTLGVTTLLELNLIKATKFVRTRYHRTSSVAEAVRLVREETANAQNDYVDGILFSKDHGVVITGQMTDEKPASAPIQTFSRARDPWFYLHVESRTRSSSPSSQAAAVEEDYVPLAEYLFRYDRAGFWVARSAWRYFRVVPFNRLTRWFLDDFIHTRMLYRALHGSGESARFIVQDVAMPFSTAEKLVDYTASELDIWPLWLCPLKRRAPPTFHPYTTSGGREEDEDNMMLNVGVWGWGPASHDAFVAANRALEAKVKELGGMKWLYAHTYYDEPEFWDMYGGRAWYDNLRRAYKADEAGLPSVYDKVQVDLDKIKAQRSGLKGVRPFGGIYGISKSIQSKDYLLHRNAEWKWRGENE
ncbi:FAD-binding domain-containing protein [Cryphonectria parasitica EP155]|uniref:Delta(24)-sterol reductase n=1 Tax=Cryphonectria parasitica (strain ATCC 38755 / EP155) TaxID=660469 RepID=A0A9P5CL08_CRYP1|nr:FAD-binding domain-containing protein [Cryphonectria parasitica EP155]KAF3761330.1 FAD-binding domain-containing protein [Cryphonectria parasitica EP155]